MRDKQFVLLCATAWRSALATRTLQYRGVSEVAHIEGGYPVCEKADARVVDKAGKPDKATHA